MKDFDNQFNQRSKQFNSTFRYAKIGMLIASVSSLAVIGFLGFVIYKLLQHFGVI